MNYSLIREKSRYHRYTDKCNGRSAYQKFYRITTHHIATCLKTMEMERILTLLANKAGLICAISYKKTSFQENRKIQNLNNLPDGKIPLFQDLLTGFKALCNYRTTVSKKI